ncbi:Mitochondrial import receptor subunit TOM22 [Sparganum proliferum]
MFEEKTPDGFIQVEVPDSPGEKAETQAEAFLLQQESPPVSTVAKTSNEDDADEDLKINDLDAIDDSDFEDETLVERLIGLTEMFPESFRNGVCTSVSAVLTGIKGTYSLSRGLLWFIASTSTVCFLPLLLELERVQVEEQEAVEQRTMMLGPTAVGGAGHSGLAGFSATVPVLTPVQK